MLLKKQRQKIQKLNLNPKKELLKYLIGNLALIGLILTLFFVLKSWFYLILIPIGLIIFFFYFINRYDVFEENKRKRLEVEFVEVFSYLRIYLLNKETVYSALEKANQYTSKEMNQKINEFLIKIDEDKSIIPFLEFARYFKNKTIEEVMISLYQMVVGGYADNYINQFIAVFENLRKRINEENLHNRYNKMNNLNIMTLIGSGYLMLVMLVVIVNIIGEMTTGF